MLEKDLQPIYEKYHSVLKPMVAEYESRNEDFVTPLLTELPFMFDHVALYNRTKEPEHMEKANECLENAIGVVRTCLVGSMMEDVNKFKSRFPDRVLMVLNEGHFYGPFKELEESVRINKNSNPAEAYALLKKMENMMAGVQGGALASSLLLDNRTVKIWKWTVTILLALIVNWIIVKLI